MAQLTEQSTELVQYLTREASMGQVWSPLLTTESSYVSPSFSSFGSPLNLTRPEAGLNGDRWAKP